MLTICVTLLMLTEEFSSRLGCIFLLDNRISHNTNTLKQLHVVSQLPLNPHMFSSSLPPHREQRAPAHSSQVWIFFVILCIQCKSPPQRCLIEAADRRQQEKFLQHRDCRGIFVLLARIMIWPVSQRGGSEGGV